ncbi:MAG: transglycosylase domain-containing protein, partial [Leptospiraceae bacterium]|nr:transglycosylase domain-containing protein [Leptospiraceae bacterium]
VARLRFLSRDRHIIRKMREAFLALLIEMRHSKSEIMEIYLNTVPLGHGTNGIEAAARFYFDKSYRELDWGEAAVLSAMTTSPSTYSPLKKPEQSRRKVGVVLNRLVQNGDITVREAEEQFRSLTEHFYATLNRSPNDSSFQQRLNLHPYATEYVKAQLPSEFRGRVLMRGGLRIYTTINHQHQQAAEEEMIPHLRRETRRRHRSPFTRFEIFEDDLGPAVRMQELIFPMAPIRRRMTRAERDFFLEFEREFQAESELLNYLSGGTNLSKAYEYLRSTGSRIAEEEQTVEGALISLRPESGAITAVIGGSGFEPRNQLIRVDARRQAGSAFKPLVYSSAIENTGRSDSADFVLTAATLIDDSPVLYVNRDLSEYSPENYSRSYEGLIRLRRGLTLSKNAVAVRTYKNVGPDYINHTVEDLLHLSERSRGQRELPREASVALGSFDVSPLEMARAYATFASNGREVHPYVISHITDAHGRILLDNRPDLERRERRQILSPGGAEIITSLLMDVVRQGTGRAAGLPGRSVAGKTGTTNRNNNAWFVGYTPELVTALYIGYDNPRSLGAGATGGGLAAPVWGRYMYKALLGEPANPFRFPGSDVVRVEICEQTGMLPGPGCGNTMVELFLPGTQPTEVNAELEGG